MSDRTLRVRNALIAGLFSVGLIYAVKVLPILDQWNFWVGFGWMWLCILSLAPLFLLIKSIFYPTQRSEDLAAFESYKKALNLRMASARPVTELKQSKTSLSEAILRLLIQERDQANIETIKHAYVELAIFQSMSHKEKTAITLYDRIFFNDRFDVADTAKLPKKALELASNILDRVERERTQRALILGATQLT